jgi:hypothetical protein
MKNPTGNDAVADLTACANDPRLEASRRDVLRFLGAFGAVTPTASLIAAIDAGLADAKAQTAAGQPVPRLSVYTPNWPDMIELWRQLSREWSALGIDLDVQQGTLDTFVSQIVAEQKLPHLGSMSWGGAPDRLDPDYFISEMFPPAAPSEAGCLRPLQGRSLTRPPTTSARNGAGGPAGVGAARPGADAGRLAVPILTIATSSTYNKKRFRAEADSRQWHRFPYMPLLRRTWALRPRAR